LVSNELGSSIDTISNKNNDLLTDEQLTCGF